MPFFTEGALEVEEQDAGISSAATVATAPKRGRGRPKGSGRKVKAPAAKEPKQQKGPWRPSSLRAMIEQHAAASGIRVRDVDPAKFLRERGLPNPLRRFRVMGQKGESFTEPKEIEAESAPIAIQRAIRQLEIEKPHQWRFHATVLEE